MSTAETARMAIPPIGINRKAVGINDTPPKINRNVTKHTVSDFTKAASGAKKKII